MKNSDRIVEGFCFATKEEADLARMELEKIKLLEERMDYRDRELVLSVYQRAIMNRTFRTPVGYQYLQSVRNRLLELGFSEEEVKPIPLTVRFASIAHEVSVKKESKPVVQKKKASLSLKGSVILNVCLVILVMAMFLITLYSDNPNILNYKTQIINEYSSWEQELKEKESELREREQELNQRENALGSQNEQN